MKKKIYFDANSSSIVTKKAKKTFLKTLKICANPSSTHKLGRKIQSKLNQSRLYISQALQVNDSNIIFTSSASESNRLLIDSICELGRKKKYLPKICCSKIEHPSLTKYLKLAYQKKLLLLFYFNLNKKGNIIWKKNYYFADFFFSYCSSQ